MRKTVVAPPITIATPGTAQPIYSSNQLVKAIIVQADNLNTGKIYVGDSTVNSSNGIELAPRESLVITPTGPNDKDILLAEVFVDTDTGGNVARIQYIF